MEQPTKKWKVLCVYGFSKNKTVGIFACYNLVVLTCQEFLWEDAGVSELGYGRIIKRELSIKGWAIWVFRNVLDSGLTKDLHTWVVRLWVN